MCIYGRNSGVELENVTIYIKLLLLYWSIYGPAIAVAEIPPSFILELYVRLVILLMKIVGFSGNNIGSLFMINYNVGIIKKAPKPFWTQCFYIISVSFLYIKFGS